MTLRRGRTNAIHMDPFHRPFADTWIDQSVGYVVRGITADATNWTVVFHRQRKGRFSIVGGKGSFLSVLTMRSANESKSAEPKTSDGFQVFCKCDNGKTVLTKLTAPNDDLCDWFADIHQKDRPTVGLHDYARAVKVIKSNGTTVPLTALWSSLVVEGQVYVKIVRKYWTMARNFDEQTFKAECPITLESCKDPDLSALPACTPLKGPVSKN